MSQQNLITQLQHVQIVTYTSDASMTMLLYDYFLTLNREISLIWPAPWTLVKVLYLLSRYMPFVDMGLRIWLDVQRPPTEELCHLVYNANCWLFFVGTALPEIILTLRTWAIWNRDWRLSICLPIFFGICWAPDIPIIITFVKSLEFTIYMAPSRGIAGCVTEKGAHIVFLVWFMLFIYEAGIFGLMLIQGIRCYKNGRSSQMFRVVFRDGLLYYLYLFVFSLANVIVLATVSPDLQTLLVVAQRCIHPILVCRAVLDIMGQASNRNQSAFFTTVTLETQTQTVPIEPIRGPIK